MALLWIKFFDILVSTIFEAHVSDKNRIYFLSSKESTYFFFSCLKLSKNLSDFESDRSKGHLNLSAHTNFIALIEPIPIFIFSHTQFLVSQFARNIQI